MVLIEYEFCSNDDLLEEETPEGNISVVDITETLSWGRNIYCEDIVVQNTNGCSPISVTVTPDFVNFIDPNERYAVCGMNRFSYNSLHQYTADQVYSFPDSHLNPEDKVVCIVYKTRQKDHCHPFLHAGHIFSAQFQFLLQHGPIDAVIGRWSNDKNFNTNTNTYNQTLDELKKDSKYTDEQKNEIAAFSTWTGKMLLPFGFTRAFVRESSLRKHNEIFVLFTRS